MRQGNVDTHHSVQIGIRGNARTFGWLKPSYEHGYDVITMNRYKQISAQQHINIFLEPIGDRPVYVTFNLDC